MPVSMLSQIKKRTTVAGSNIKKNALPEMHGHLILRNGCCYSVDLFEANTHCCSNIKY